MDKTFQKGDYLELELKEGSTYRGWFQSQKKDKSISLINDQTLPLENAIRQRLIFYSPEVKNVRRIQEPRNSVDDHAHVATFTNKEVDKFEVVAKNFIFVNQIDNDYFRAMKDIKNNSVISLGTDGSEMGRKCKLPILTISTPLQIYIFDIQVMQKSCFDSGLRDILESQVIKKIVHNSRKLSDCLYHKHQVKLTNVFDTQVADVIIYRNKFHSTPDKFKTLQECLNYYLGLNLTISEKVDIVEWSQRPLTTNIKEIASTNVIYLHKLSEILQNEMMAPFTKGVTYFVDRLRDSTDFEAWTLSSQETQLSEEFQEAIGFKLKKQ